MFLFILQKFIGHVLQIQLLLWDPDAKLWLCTYNLCHTILCSCYLKFSYLCNQTQVLPRWLVKLGIFGCAEPMISRKSAQVIESFHVAKLSLCYDISLPFHFKMFQVTYHPFTLKHGAVMSMLCMWSWKWSQLLNHIFFHLAWFPQ